MNPEAPPSIPPETPIVGYCRACGKALDAASVHTAHGTIYCAEHVPAEPIFPAKRFSLRQPLYSYSASRLRFRTPTCLRESLLSWG